ncbi:MAG: transcriptional regulator GlxA family with amidase domain [Yoonia sp.]|jgi:transcriptional regulator GlxA family with amidase domain
MQAPRFEKIAGRTDARGADEKPYMFVFILLDGFSHLSFISAVETLQTANMVAESRLYDWTTCGLSDGFVRSSVGLEVGVDNDIRQLNNPPELVIVSGEGAFDMDIGRLKVWLSRFVRGRTRVSGLGTGSILMARAGLLQDTAATVHPWYRTGFAEIFPDVTLSRQTHISEGLRCSSSGGVSGVDLFLDLVAQQHGTDFSSSVAESMCYSPIRLLQKSVDTGAPNSMTVLQPIVSRAISKMENTIADPVSPSTLAKELGISTRQLERLFRRYIGMSPKRHYMRLRLREAYRLLVQSHLDITDVAFATGFASSSHFSKCFKAEFSASPFALKRTVNKR